ncbi:MAG: DUF501 domain-containing protein [Coriobacteriia bacterium]|nr:DUF501 domain-containing protein [Coriobacteriia bacterium]
MGAEPAVPTPSDHATIVAQLGREPRGRWWVEVRCSFDYPQVIGTPPLLDGAVPFPTLYWLTCPWLVGGVSATESGGDVASWAGRLAADPALAERMRRADERYREHRAAASPFGDDPCPDVGIAGQRDSLATKCLHAHVATALAGIDDPVGAELLATLGRSCPDGRCVALTCLREETP